MIPAIALIVLGLIALVAGGELLVRGASRLASVVGISPLVIGLTVVAFGTAPPNLLCQLSHHLEVRPTLRLVTSSEAISSMCYSFWVFQH